MLLLLLLCEAGLGDASSSGLARNGTQVRSLWGRVEYSMTMFDLRPRSRFTGIRPLLGKHHVSDPL